MSGSLWWVGSTSPSSSVFRVVVHTWSEGASAFPLCLPGLYWIVNSSSQSVSIYHAMRLEVGSFFWSMVRLDYKVSAHQVTKLC